MGREGSCHRRQKGRGGGRGIEGQSGELDTKLCTIWQNVQGKNHWFGDDFVHKFGGFLSVDVDITFLRLKWTRIGRYSPAG